MQTDMLKEIWPEWEIEKQLGKGSFGVVYQAVRKDFNVESRAAIKVISIPTDESEVDSLRSEGINMDSTRAYFQGIVNDFVGEIQIMESLKGVQNIVSVEDYKVVEKTGSFGWNIYIRMELLTPFNTYVRDKKLTESEVIRLGMDICTALEICGKRNIIHRDIKPENIFINDFGSFKIGDFGIARKLENLTGGLSRKGTFQYMAPEVALSTDYDARVDIYSLGIVLYRLMNENRFPFLETEEQVLNPYERNSANERRMRGERLPAPCEASSAMANLILRACSFEAGMRFTSAAEMKKALASVADGSYKIVDIDGDTDRTACARPSGNGKIAASAYKIDKTVSQDKNIFVNETPGSKTKGKVLKIIAVGCLIVVLALAAVFTVPRLIKDNAVETGNQKSVKNDDKVSSVESSDKSVDGEKINSILAEAETLAGSGDYKSALIKIQAGLKQYPEAEALTDKETEYSAAVDIQVKEKTLSEAAEYVTSGDYKSALALLKKALTTYKDDADYQAAYDTYNQEYMLQVKGDSLTKADDLMQQLDYLGAIQTIEQAASIVGEDIELQEKLQEYGEAYISDVLSKVDICLESKDFDEAEKILGEAVKEFPQNQELKDKSDIVEKSKPKYLLTVCPPYESENYEERNQITMGSVTYTNGFTIGYGGLAIFNLNSNYENISFTLGHADGSAMSNVDVCIYLDGQLAEKIEVSCEALPQEHTLALKGAAQMKIVTENGSISMNYGFGNVVVY